jgi:hypothetical protein
VLAGWSPSVYRLITRDSHEFAPLKLIGPYLSENTRDNDLIIVHSIPSAIAGIARYMDGLAPMVAWTGQLEMRDGAHDMPRLVAGKSRVILVRIHDVGASAPQQDWLIMNAKRTRRLRRGSGVLFFYEPPEADVFPPPATAPTEAIHAPGS